MAQLRLNYQRFTAMETEIIAVGPEGYDEFKSFWDREKMPFPGIPDPHHYIGDLYGQEVRVFSLGRMPALFLIDRDGKVRYIHKASAMWDIPPAGRLLEIISALPGADQEDSAAR